MMTAPEAETDQRVCGGWHPPAYPPPALRPDERLCRPCVGRTMRALEELSMDFLELEVTVVRQSAVRHGGSARRTPRDMTSAGDVELQPVSLPFNTTASDVRRDAEQRLIEWAEYIAAALGIRLRPVPSPARPPSTTAPPTPRPPAVERCTPHDMVIGTCATCLGLPDPELLDQLEPVFVDAPPIPREPTKRPPAKRITVALALLRSRAAKNWLRVDEQGSDCADAIAYVRGRVRNAIDRFDRRWYAGECGQPVTVVDLVDDPARPLGLKPVTREDTCRADLYATPGKAVVTCDGYREPGGVGGCGALHPAVSRQKYVLATLRSRWLPLDVILSVVPQLLGYSMPAQDTVRQWRHRKKLRPIVCLVKHTEFADRASCRLCRRELYVGGQVLDVVVAAEQRRRRAVCLVKHADRVERRSCWWCTNRSPRHASSPAGKDDPGGSVGHCHGLGTRSMPEETPS